MARLLLRTERWSQNTDTGEISLISASLGPTEWPSVAAFQKAQTLSGAEFDGHLIPNGCIEWRRKPYEFGARWINRCTLTDSALPLEEKLIAAVDAADARRGDGRVTNVTRKVSDLIAAQSALAALYETPRIDAQETAVAS